MSWVLDMVMPERKNRRLLFNTAMESSDQIQNLYKLLREGDFKIDPTQMAFTKVFPHDENSPAIFWLDDKQMIIRYPRYSTPYNHSFKGMCKFVECLSGKLYDKNSNLKLFPGDKVKVKPDNDIEPYTEESVCYLRVCIGDCKSTWEQVCGS